MKIRKLISGILAICIFAIVYVPCANAEENTVLTVDVNRTVREITSRMYGLNFGWGASENNKIMLTGDGTDINPKYIQLFQDNLPLSRAGGMGANGFEWKKAIGDLEDRTAQETYTGQGTSVVRYGLTEWISGNYAADENAGFAYVVNLSDLENLADLVRFLRLNPSDPNAVGTDSTNWAQKRVDLGIENPVPIAIWELGNEVENAKAQGGLALYRPADYASACQQAIEIIKGIDPGAKICVEIQAADNASMSADWDENWNAAILGLASTSASIDYVSIHNYCNWENLSGAEARFESTENIANDMSAAFGKEIKVYVSEHAANRTSKAWGTDFGYMLPHTLGGTLATAEYFTKAFEYDCIDSMAYYALNGASWVAAYEFRGNLYFTAPGTLLKILNSNFTGSLLESELDTDKDKLFAKAVKTDNGVNILLVNRETEAVTVDFNFDNAPSEGYNLISKSYISGTDNGDDYYKVANPTNASWDPSYNKTEIEMVTDEVVSVKHIQSYEVAPLSVVVLNLEEALPRYAVGSYQKIRSSQYYFGNPNGLDADGYRSTMGASFSSLVGSEIDGSTVASGDYVITSNITAAKLNDFMSWGNGITNAFIWKADAEGNVTKLRGGTGIFNNFYGYCDNGGAATEYAFGQSTTPFIYVYGNDVAGDGTGMSVWVRPKPGKYVTYGREDLDLSGLSTFTFKFAYNVRNPGKGLPKIMGFLTQGYDQKYKNPSKKFQLFSILGSGEVRDFDNTGSSGVTLATNLGIGLESAYYTMKIIVDNTGETPRAMYELKNGSGTILRTSAWKNIPAETFDFSEDMGFKLHFHDEANGDNVVLLGYYDFGTVRQEDGKYKETIRIKNSSGSAISNAKRISALYDEDEETLIDIQVESVPTVENGKTVLYDTELNINGTPNPTVKHFLWNSFEGIQALGRLDRTKELPTIVCQ